MESTSHLKQIIGELDKKFTYNPTESTTDNNSISQSNTIDNVREAALSFFTVKTLERSFDLFIKSILSGEYYYESSSSCLEEIRSAYQSFFSYIEKIDLDNNSNVMVKLFGENYSSKLFNSIESDYINVYSALLQSAFIHLDNNENILLFSNEVSLSLDFKNFEPSAKYIKENYEKLLVKPDFKLKYNFLSSLFKINVIVAEYDNKFRFEESYVRDLYKIKMGLSFVNQTKTRVLQLIKIIYDKVDFLLYKAIYRTKYSTIFDPSNPLSPNIDENLSFKSFINKTNSRYSLSENGKKTFAGNSTEYLSAYQNFENNNATFSDIIFLSKFYSKNYLTIDPNCEKTNKLISYADVVLKLNINKNPDLYKFELLAFNSTHFLLEKNKLKILCSKFQNNSTNFESVVNQFKVCKELEKSYSRYDYYHYYLIYNVFIKKIEEFKNNKEKIDIVKKMMEILEENEDAYNNNLNWMKGRLPLYLPYKESTVENSLVNNLFLDSSYVLPIDYDSLNKIKLTLFNEFLKHKIYFKAKESIDVLSSVIESDINKFKTNIDEFKSDIKDEKKNNMQILGIFSALIAFIVTSVSAVTRFENIYTLVIFMMGFVVGLILFVYAINVVYKPEKVEKGFWPKIIIYPSIIITFLIFLKLFNVVNEDGIFTFMKTEKEIIKNSFKIENDNGLFNLLIFDNDNNIIKKIPLENKSESKYNLPDSVTINVNSINQFNLSDSDSIE